MSDKQPPEYAEGWGELIRAHRAYIGISQRTMAAKLNMGERSLSDIEVGRRSCPPGFLNAVQDVTQEFYRDVERVMSTASTWSDDNDGDMMELPINDDPKREWSRAVIHRAAVESGDIMPTIVGDA